MSRFLLDQTSPREDLTGSGGGKAAQLAVLAPLGYHVPSWFCIHAEAFDAALDEAVARAGGSLANAAPVGLHALPMPQDVANAVRAGLSQYGLEDEFVAVRSSGLEEDGTTHSFAGQFESLLYRRGHAEVIDAVSQCWASAFSERITAYRRAADMGDGAPRMGVIVQRMVNSEAAGVAFSRNPLRPTDRDTVVVEAVWGQGEGLVGGELEADRFDVDRNTLAFQSVVATKTHQRVHDVEQGGTTTIVVEPDRAHQPSLTPGQVVEVARLAIRLEDEMGSPQDCEWAFVGDELHVLQSRPITTLPPPATFDASVAGDHPVIWDNSNIIESYAGVTTPLTFSHVSRSYREVYYMTCRVGGVPADVMTANDDMFRNMLGLIRGRIYYNLVNWYRLLSLFPLLGNSKGFMETMMGVKQSLTGELAVLVDPSTRAPRYGLFKRLYLGLRLIYNITVGGSKARADFLSRVDGACRPHEDADLDLLSITDQLAIHRRLEDDVLRHWTAPINNDIRCMMSFGILTSVTQRWIAPREDNVASLQNDLLCGEGDLKSTEPTRILLVIARELAEGDAEVRERFMAGPPEQVWAQLDDFAPALHARFTDYLRNYGFRCVDELKLETLDLHDQPHVLIGSVQDYVRHGVPSAEEMRASERAIRDNAEQQVTAVIRGPKRWFYFKLLRWTRRAVSDRELLRFERTRAFGLMRRLFRAIGSNLADLGILPDGRDVFYLTVEELIAFGEGRPISLDLARLAALRRTEYEEYKRTPAPPDRFVTRGAAGASFRHPDLLADSDLLPAEDADANGFHGTPCCPGVVEAPVRVATSFDDCRGINGEILVTERTDPGWIPVFPACAGLIIERGSLLSHSAVVARELGIPTIVGVGGSPLTRLTSGQIVRMDAGKGDVRIVG
jgi:phosphohistidine swiveling domain-containing protein